jgi:hypothetical protein
MLKYVCDRCGKDVHPPDGVVHLRKSDLDEAEVSTAVAEVLRAAEDAIGQKVRTAADITPIRRAPWVVAHDDCVTEDDVFYDIDLAEVAQWPGVVRWTSHLLGKVWFPVTAWDHFLTKVLKNNS